MLELKKKVFTYAKISPNMVNPIIAGGRRRRRSKKKKVVLSLFFRLEFRQHGTSTAICFSSNSADY